MRRLFASCAVVGVVAFAGVSLVYLLRAMPKGEMPIGRVPFNKVRYELDRGAMRVVVTNDTPEAFPSTSYLCRWKTNPETVAVFDLPSVPAGETTTVRVPFTPKAWNEKAVFSCQEVERSIAFVGTGARQIAVAVPPRELSTAQAQGVLTVSSTTPHVASNVRCLWWNGFAEPIGAEDVWFPEVPEGGSAQAVVEVPEDVRGVDATVICARL